MFMNEVDGEQGRICQQLFLLRNLYFSRAQGTVLAGNRPPIDINDINDTLQMRADGRYRVAQNLRAGPALFPNGAGAPQPNDNLQTALYRR